MALVARRALCGACVFLSPFFRTAAHSVWTASPQTHVCAHFLTIPKGVVTTESSMLCLPKLSSEEDTSGMSRTCSLQTEATPTGEPHEIEGKKSRQK